MTYCAKRITFTSSSECVNCDVPGGARLRAGRASVCRYCSTVVPKRAPRLASSEHLQSFCSKSLCGEIECEGTTQLAHFMRWTAGKVSEPARFLLWCGNGHPDSSGIHPVLRFWTAYSGHGNPDIGM